MQPLILAALTIVSFGAGILCVQDKQAPRFTHPMPKDMEAGMARWMQTCKPSHAHQRLKELLGTYETTQRMMGMPGETKGTAEFTWLTEGKWLQQKWSGSMMGQPTSGITILGYDNFKERFVECQVNSLMTALGTTFGHFDESGDDLILWGTIDEPMTPEQDKQVKYVYRGFGKDKFTWEVHDMMIGEKNTKVVEVEYVRKK